MKKAKLMLYVSIVGFLISALSVFLVPFSTGENALQDTVGVVAGILFWLGILIGIAFYLIVWVQIRNGEYQVLKKKFRPACITFFTKPIALITDAAFLVALAVTIVGNTLVVFGEIVQLILMAVLLFTFFVHFILNGKVYRYLTKDYQREEKKSEK